MKRIIKYVLSVMLAALTVLSSCTPKKTDPETADETTVPAASQTEPGTTVEEKTDPVEEEDVMDLIMLYDIDSGMSINTRPDHGWWNLNPEYPDDPGPDGGPYRVTTSLLGTYDSSDKDVIRQHFYWMAAMGVDGVQCDITNTRSPRLQGYEGMAKYFNGTLNSFTSVLDVSAEKPDNYKNPKAYVSIRLFGEEYDGLQMLLDDLYDIYGEHGDGWYKFNDGSERADRPFIVIFADWALLEKWSKKDNFPFDDERFNIRWSNGYLGGCVKKDADGGKYIEENDPLWLFVENESAGEEGYYVPYYKKGADGEVEMMQTWASVHLGGESWDGMTDLIDGKLCIERYSEPVKKYRPKALLINRWNYPIAWPAEPQEGLSRNKSTHIEPNEDWGFDAFYSTSRVMSDIEGKTVKSPGKPTLLSVSGGRLFFDTAGMPLEVCVARRDDFSDGVWQYVDIVSGVDPGTSRECTLYVKFRGAGGEGPAAEMEFIPDNDTQPSEDGVIMTAEQFVSMKPDGDYTLGADIDMSGVSFRGIPNFSGSLNGMGHTVSNVDMAGGSGIFAYTEDAVISDLTVENVQLQSDGLICGLLVGKAVRTDISGVTVKYSTIYGSRFIGGLAGVNDHSTFSNIVLDNVYLIISAEESDTIGGVAGYSEFGINENILFNGVIEAPNAVSVGGIIGSCLGNASADDNIVRNCFAKGSVTGKANCGTVGGIIGMAHSSDGNWFAPVDSCGAFLDFLSEGAGRICGSFGEGCLSGNYALETLLPDAADKGDDRRDGADITATEAEKLLSKAGLSS